MTHTTEQSTPVRRVTPARLWSQGNTRGVVIELHAHTVALRFAKGQKRFEVSYDELMAWAIKREVDAARRAKREAAKGRKQERKRRANG